MGGADPPTSLSQACIPPPPSSGSSCQLTVHQESLWLPLGANPQGANPSGVFPGVVPPQMAPLISGLLGFARSIPGRFVTDFHRFFQTFLGDILVIVELYSQLTTCSHTCFFFRNRPLEKLPHQSCRAFRGEVDSSIPRVFGGLLVVVFEARENSSVSN